MFFCDLSDGKAPVLVFELLVEQVLGLLGDIQTLKERIIELKATNCVISSMKVKKELRDFKINLNYNLNTFPAKASVTSRTQRNASPQ